MTATARSWLTVRDLAELAKVDEDVVRAWIASGQLAAIDVSEQVGGKRRWRIDPAEWEAFKQRRSSRPEPKAPRRRRLRQAGEVAFY